MSWNIQFGLAVETAIDELLHEDDLRGADIVLLQEMDGAGVAAIATALDADVAYATRRPHAQTGRDFGNAVVSRWPIRARHEVELPHEAAVSGHPRSATHALVDVAGVEVSAYSVHTEIPALRLARRVEQFDALAADVSSRGHGHVVIGGDFNTVTARGARALEASMGRAGLERLSATAPASYARFGREMSLDHVFGAGVCIVSSGVVATTSASDHLPIWVEVTPSRAPS